MGFILTKKQITFLIAVASGATLGFAWPLFGRWNEPNQTPAIKDLVVIELTAQEAAVCEQFTQAGIVSKSGWQHDKKRLLIAATIAQKMCEALTATATVRVCNQFLDDGGASVVESNLFARSFGYGIANEIYSLEPGLLGKLGTAYHLGSLCATEREPSPGRMLSKLLKSGSDGARELDAVSIRDIVLGTIQWAAESGYLDAQKVVQVLRELATEQRMKPHDSVELFARSMESCAIFSPNTFPSLVRTIAKIDSAILFDAIMESELPPELFTPVLLADAADRDDTIRSGLAIALTEKVLNGTAAEVRTIVAILKDPTQIPIEASVNLTLALALSDPKELDNWLKKAPPDAQKRILKELFRTLVMSPRKVELGSYRLGRMLGCDAVVRGAHPDVLMNLINASDPGFGVEHLRRIAETYENANTETAALVRSAARSTMMFRDYEALAKQDMVALRSAIETEFASEAWDKAKAGYETLALRDRVKAREMLDVATGTEQKRLMLNALIGHGNVDESFATRYNDIQALLDLNPEERAALDASIIRFSQVGGRYDPSAVQSLFKLLPDDNLRGKATEAFVGDWAKYDPIGASEWLGTLPPSRTRDGAIAQLVASSYDDPEMALANSAAIDDSKLRTDANAKLIAYWKEIDSARLVDLVKASLLSESEKAALLLTLESGGKK